ncbi:CLUMA_CG016753, isoform A [Clunio marinus]|uniref:Dynein regulatory complex protein 10 n=1 Tax=Clunio marinus TaxID=568069 RepID=A0A1J1IVB5_9DIPT|nr:CLUMA_CG016753, isoform A [Clunio marinus]
MDDIDFDDFFEPEEENVDDFNFIDPSILKQFQRRISCEIKLSDDDEIYGEKATRKFEFQIQVNRILQIFDEMIEKIETLLCIQEFVKDRKLMEKYFNDSDINNLTKYCSGKDLEVDMNDEKESEKISQLIQSLLNSDLHKHVDSYKNNISLQKKMLFSSIKELRNIIDLRLQLTAPKELKKEQILHQMWKKYGKTKEKIATLREKWIYRKQNFEEKMQDKYETIERFKREIEMLRKQNETEIQNRIQESNVNIVELCEVKDHAIAQKFKAAEQSKVMYNEFLHANLSRERKLREQKQKAVQAFQAILHKYDIEVGEERTRELDDLQNALELQRKEFATWKESVCEPQIKLHAHLMHERDEAERREMEQSMMIFMMNRSAKILQKYWRNLVAKRRKKKGRRGGKKK